MFWENQSRGRGAVNSFASLIKYRQRHPVQEITRFLFPPVWGLHKAMTTNKGLSSWYPFCLSSDSSERNPLFHVCILNTRVSPFVFANLFIGISFFFTYLSLISVYLSLRSFFLLYLLSANTDPLKLLTWCWFLGCFHFDCCFLKWASFSPFFSVGAGYYVWLARAFVLCW